MTNENSYDNVRDWAKEIENNAENHTNIIRYLVGNRCDLTEQRKIKKDEAENLAKELNFQEHYETSAFTGENCEKVFTNITK